jgi:hypothetical protein
MTPDADTHTAATAYGEVEIEVVECASCGTTVARDSAEPFRIGEDPAVREGWACEHCATEGPAGFPLKSGEFSAKVDGMIAVAFAPLLVGMTIPKMAQREDVSTRALWFLLGAFAGLFWLAVCFAPVLFAEAIAVAGGEVPL